MSSSPVQDLSKGVGDHSLGWAKDEKVVMHGPTMIVHLMQTNVSEGLSQVHHCMHAWDILQGEGGRWIPWL